YLKSALCHLAGERGRRERGRFQPLPEGSEQEDLLTATAESDAEADGQRFVELWGTELLDRTWEAMAASSLERGDQFCEVLRLEPDRPEESSAGLAAELTRRHGRAVTAEGVRQTLRRARARFVELLRAEVAASVPTTDETEIDAELADLGLLAYCQPA